MISYVGSKHRIAKRLIQYYPSHKVYVEPFGGSGSMFFYKEPSEKEVYNDINQSLVNLFRVLRDEEKTQRLIRMFEYAINSVDFVREAYENYRNPNIDEITRAYYVIYSLESSRGMLNKSASLNGVRNLEFKRNLTIRKIRSVYERFKNVVIENVDWKDCFRRYDSKDTLFYCDPPYLVYTSEKIYQNTINHEEFLDVVQSCQGMVIVSNYDNELYNARLKDWEKVCFKTYVSCNIPDTKTAERIEVIWVKPNCLSRLQQQRLFEVE